MSVYSQIIRQSIRKHTRIRFVTFSTSNTDIKFVSKVNENKVHSGTNLEITRKRFTNLLAYNVRSLHATQKVPGLYENETGTQTTHNSEVKPQTSDTSNNLPTQEQLEKLHKALQKEVKHFFVNMMNYALYDFKNFVYETDISGKRKVYNSLVKYALQLWKYKWYINSKSVKAQVTVLGSSADATQGSIKVEWGVPLVNHRALIKWKPGAMGDNVKKNVKWIDGVSTFYIGTNGLIYKHILQKVERTDAERKPPDVTASDRTPSDRTPSDVTATASDKTPSN